MVASMDHHSSAGGRGAQTRSDPATLAKGTDDGQHSAQLARSSHDKPCVPDVWLAMTHNPFQLTCVLPSCLFECTMALVVHLMRSSPEAHA